MSRLAHFLGIVWLELPRVLPAVLLTVAVVAVAHQPLARRLRCGPVLAAALLLATGTILLITLTPIRAELIDDAARAAVGHCVSGGWAPTWLPWPVSDRSLNVALFVPLGAAAGLIPRVRPRLWMLLAAAGLPMLIELVQSYLVPGRACDTRDVSDNLYGLLLGAGAGTLLSRPRDAAWRPRRGVRPPPPRR